MKPQLFIILLNYNGWKDTVECVRSIRASCKKKYTIVVVDNKSTNNSVEILQREIGDEIVLLKAQSNKGFSAGNNIGIKYALSNGAEYVLLLNNDTIVKNDFFDDLLEFAQNNSQLGCISSRIYYYENKDKIWYDGGDFNYHTGRAIHYRFNEISSDIHGVNEAGFVSGCFMLIPIPVIQQIGFMDERYFLYVEDTEYSLRIKKAGYKLYWNAEHCIYHKVNSSTKKLSNTIQYYEIRNRLLLCDTYLTKMQLFEMKIYNIIFYTYKIMRGVYSITALKEAYRDWKNNNFGKKETIL